MENYQKPYVTPSEVYKRAYAELEKKFGKYDIPAEEITKIAERLRAYYATLSDVPPNDLFSHMRKLMLPMWAIEEALGDDRISVTTPVKRADKYKKLNAWWRENVGAQVTVPDVAAAGDFSPSTANTYVSDHPDVFIKVKRGLYEIRDPEVERKRDKYGVV